MTIEHEWHVVVKDEAGKAITDARVALVPEATRTGKEFPYAAIAATHTHAADGKYDPAPAIAGAEGGWVLIVTRKDRSPVVQPLALKKHKEELVVSTPGGRVATLVLSAEVAKVAGNTVRRVTFVVTLHPSSKLVFVAGTDYFSKGVTHRDFAESRMRILRTDKKIDDGTIQVLFACDERAHVFLALPSSGSKLVEIARKQIGPRTILEGNVEDILPGRDHQKDPAKDVAVVQFYKYLAQLGKDEPKSVREAGLFSHSWPGGPILYNTDEGAAFSSAAGRDPNDLDARVKDFNATNTAGWADMKKAFADKALFRVWGCSATRHTRRKMIEMNNRGHKDGTFFTVNTDEQGHGSTTTVLWEDERLTPEMLRFQLDQELRDESYMGAAAGWLGPAATVSGAPPGAGSDLWSAGSLQWMMVNTSTYASNYTYLSREFKPDFERTSGKHDDGYMNYSKMVGRAAAAKPAFSPRYYKFTRYLNDHWAMLELTHIAKQLPANTDTHKVQLHVVDDPPVFAPAKGTLYTLEDQIDPTRSTAFFHQDDQTVRKVTRDPVTHKFTVLGALVP